MHLRCPEGGRLRTVQLRSTERRKQTFKRLGLLSEFGPNPSLAVDLMAQLHAFMSSIAGECVLT